MHLILIKLKVFESQKLHKICRLLTKVWQICRFFLNEPRFSVQKYPMELTLYHETYIFDINNIIVRDYVLPFQRKSCRGGPGDKFYHLST